VALPGATTKTLARFFLPVRFLLVVEKPSRTSPAGVGASRRRVQALPIKDNDVSKIEMIVWPLSRTALKNERRMFGHGIALSARIGPAVMPAKDEDPGSGIYAGTPAKCIAPATSDGGTCFDRKTSATTTLRIDFPGRAAWRVEIDEL
jgi:hypothetical protein